jgi:ferric-dicitrate binding protein FerR (iron transport regulator)
MSDRLLRELGDLARSETKAEEARFDERWDRLAAGTLTAEEEAELKALSESSPENQEAFEAFRPLGAEFQARMVSAIQSNQAEQTAEKRQQQSQKPPPPVLPFPPVIPRPVSLRAKVRVGFAAAAAMAAGVIFMVWPPSPLPGYEASLTGGFKTNRGIEIATPNQKPILTLGAPFTLEVGPKEPLEHPGKVQPSAFLSSSAGREPLTPLRLEGKFETGNSGSVRLNATMGEDIKVKAGDWIFWTVVARNSPPEAKEVEARLRANQPQDASWQTLCDALHQEVKPPPSPWQVACAGFQTVEGQPDP